MIKVIGTSLMDSSAWTVEDYDGPATNVAVIDETTESVWAAAETEEDARAQVEVVQWSALNKILAFSNYMKND